MANSNVTCTRRIQFCAGHRVMGHENKCGHLHGHNYVVEVTAQARDGLLDGIGRVIDFSVLKDRVGGWIEQNWDHGFLVFAEDKAVVEVLRDFHQHRIDKEDGTQKIYHMSCNPTAENIAEFLLMQVGPTVLKDTGVQLVKVVVHETENCKAEVHL